MSIPADFRISSTVVPPSPNVAANPRLLIPRPQCTTTSARRRPVILRRCGTRAHRPAFTKGTEVSKLFLWASLGAICSTRTVRGLLRDVRGHRKSRTSIRFGTSSVWGLLARRWVGNGRPPWLAEVSIMSRDSPQAIPVRIRSWQIDCPAWGLPIPIMACRTSGARSAIDLTKHPLVLSHWKRPITFVGKGDRSAD
jgi:hypothetical protein